MKLGDRGFYMYPGVPISISVSQEADRAYGPMKIAVRENLIEVVDQRIIHNVSVSLAPWTVGLFLFGGRDPVTGFQVERNAYGTRRLSRGCVLRSWISINW